MQSLPQNIRDRFDRLRQSLWRTDVRPDDKEQIGLLEQLGRSGGPGEVPALLDFLFAANEAVAASAADSLDQIVRRCTSVELARLDAAVREISDWRWEVTPPDSVHGLAQGRTGTMGVLSFDRSGFVREAAVRSLAATFDGGELPFLLIRLNDWVSAVREAASVAVRSRLRADYALHFVRHLPLVARLRLQGRDDHRDITQAILRMLATPEARPILLAGLDRLDRRARRAAFGFLLDADGDFADLVERGLSSEDALLRLRAVRAARARFDGPELARVLERTKADRFMPVRREALYGYAERLPDLAQVELQAWLMDPLPSMREAARFYLRQRGHADFAGWYRERLGGAGGVALATGVAGLGETGEKDDVRLLEPFLTHPDPRVRRAVMRGVGRLDGDAHVERFVAVLEDTSPSVAKGARDALRPRLNLVPPQRLWSVFDHASQAHTRRYVLSLAAELRWWDRAPMLAAAAASGDEEVTRLALTHLHWTDPSRLTAKARPVQLQLLDETLRRHGERLPKAVLSSLASDLAYARRESQ